jgi:hypothetical protein
VADVYAGWTPLEFLFWRGQICVFYVFFYLPLPIFFPEDAALFTIEDVFTATLTTACHHVAFVRKKVFNSCYLKENYYLLPLPFSTTFSLPIRFVRSCLTFIFGTVYGI